MSQDFKGKNVLVTGGSRGIGFAIASRFAVQGARVVITATREETLAQALSQFQANDLQTVKGLILDLTILTDAGAVFNQASDLLGGEPVDILVNNAGIIRREDAINFSEKDWDDVMNVNIKTVFFMSQAVAKQFIKQGHGGKIINVASMLSYQGGIRVPSYTASKSAVMGVTRLLANEWAKHGINVNAVAPGYMATNNTQQLRKDEERSKEILDRIPAGRWGLPDDLKGPVVFLASKASDYISGYTIAVDGGWLAR